MVHTTRLYVHISVVIKIKGLGSEFHVYYIIFLKHIIVFFYERRGNKNIYMTSNFIFIKILFVWTGFVGKGTHGNSILNFALSTQVDGYCCVFEGHVRRQESSLLSLLFYPIGSLKKRSRESRFVRNSRQLRGKCLLSLL